MRRLARSRVGVIDHHLGEGRAPRIAPPGEHLGLRKAKAISDLADAGLAFLGRDLGLGLRAPPSSSLAGPVRASVRHATGIISTSPLGIITPPSQTGSDSRGSHQPREGGVGTTLTDHLAGRRALVADHDRLRLWGLQPSGPTPMNPHGCQKLALLEGELSNVQRRNRR